MLESFDRKLHGRNGRLFGCVVDCVQNTRYLTHVYTSHEGSMFRLLHGSIFIREKCTIYVRTRAAATYIGCAE